MTQPLFEYLASFGFKRLGRGIPDLVGRMGRKELIEFAQGAEEAATYAERRARTPYEFSASETFAGAPTPCASMSCRFERVREVAYFAALYADRVLVSSPFSGMGSIRSHSALRYEVAAALTSSLYLKPLLNAGLIEYTRPLDERVCLECYAKLSGQTAKEWSRVIADLEQEYRQRVKYYIERQEGYIFVVPDGSPDLFDVHSIRPLKSVPKPMRTIARGDGRWLMPAPLVDDLQLPKEYASEIARDILGRELRAGRFGTGYLTRREVDLRVASKAMNPTSDTLIDRDFGHELPMVDGLAPADLIKLRNNETDAFKTYQDALRRAATEAANNRAVNLTELFRDVVAPEIRRMNVALASARQSLVRGLAADAASATALVSLAFFGGLFTPSLAAAVSAIGGIHFTNKVAGKLSKLVKQEPEHARENPFYFLWKVSNLGKRMRRRTK